jgi:hypothetical protein
MVGGSTMWVMANWMLVFALCALTGLCAMLMGAVALLGSEMSFAVAVEVDNRAPAPGGIRWRVAVGPASL